MAKKPAEKKAKPAPVRKNNSGQSLLWVFMLSIVMFVFPESIILVFIGLLPTLVALIIDKSPKKYSTFCVGAMNITGVFPSLLELWAGNNNISHAVQIITNVFDLIVMYAAASFGWLLYIAIPPVVNALLAVVAQHRITQLRGRQRELIREWGENIIAGSRDADTAETPQGTSASTAEPKNTVLGGTPPVPS